MQIRNVITSWNEGHYKDGDFMLYGEVGGFNEEELLQLVGVAVELWHQSSTDEPLCTWLGMDAREYKLFVENQPLTKIVPQLAHKRHTKFELAILSVKTLMSSRLWWTLLFLHAAIAWMWILFLTPSPWVACAILGPWIAYTGIRCNKH